MIPLKDSITSKTFPIVNTLIIIINVFIFFYQTTLGESEMSGFWVNYALIPDKIFHPSHYSGVHTLAIYPFITHIFLHANLMHLAGNMLFLFIFGDNVEDKMGHLKYLIFYLACGLIAGGVQTFFSLGSDVPMVGASGAIAGVLGAYFLLFPGAYIVCLFWYFIFIRLIKVPAIIFLGLWFVMQFVNSMGSLGSSGGGGVAWFAHLGGFIAGFILVKFFAEKGKTEYF